MACRWRCNLFSSSELCEEDDGSTSETPESAGLGGNEPEILQTNPVKACVEINTPLANPCQITFLFKIQIFTLNWWFWKGKWIKTYHWDGVYCWGVAGWWRPASGSNWWQQGGGRGHPLTRRRGGRGIPHSRGSTRSWVPHSTWPPAFHFHDGWRNLE